MGPGKNLRAIIEESFLEEWEPCFDNNAKSIFKPVSIETPSDLDYQPQSGALVADEYDIEWAEWLYLRNEFIWIVN